MFFVKKFKDQKKTRQTKNIVGKKMARYRQFLRSRDIVGPGILIILHTVSALDN